MGLELAKAFIRVRADSSRLGPDFRAVKGVVTSQVAKLTALVGGGLSAATAVLATKKALGLAADLETTTVAFTTMLGSGEAAKKMLEDIQKFAAATPFEMPGLQDAARTLLAFGFSQEDIMPTLKTLGDVSAGTGKDLKELAVIFGQIKSAGRLMGQDLLQLINAGFNPLQIMSEQTGRSMADLKKDMEAGKIGFDQVLGAFQAVTSEGGMFFNMMEEQSKTLSGRISTLKDAVNSVFREVGQALMPAAKEAVEELLSIVENNKQSIVSLGQSVGEFVRGMITWIKVLVTEWEDVWELLKTQAMLNLSLTADFFINLWRGIPKILMAAVDIMKVALLGHLRTVGIVVKGIGSLFANVFDSIRKMWDALWTDETVWGAYKEGAAKQAGIFMDIGKDVAENIKDTVSKNLERSGKLLDDIDLTKASAESETLREMRDAIAQKLGEAFVKASPKAKEVGEEIAGPIQEGVKQAAKSAGVGLDFGRFGIAELGRRAQDAALKKDDKMVGLLQSGNMIQTQILNEMKKRNEQRPTVGEWNLGLT